MKKNWIFLVASFCFCLIHASAQDPQILVGTNLYVAYNTGLQPGTYVYLDADPAAGLQVRATQRSLGYREVLYKAILPGTLAFNPVPPKSMNGVLIYDYSAQINKTNIVGYWANKDVPVMIGPDGRGYISDGHHTTAGYVSPENPVREILPGKKRIILGHITANFYDAKTGPAPVTDAWWLARAAENNAMLYGVNGDLLALPGEPNYATLQPVLPSVLAMPTTPSALTTNGAIAMFNSPYRSLAWGLADGIIVSATDAAKKKIVGYKKSPPGSDVDMFFVEFYWGDYLRNRVVWDNTAGGSFLGSGQPDANAVAAPLSFIAAVANGIALAKSEIYLDEFGRNLSAYTNTALFSSNTVNWAQGSISNGLAAAGNTYHMFLRDDSGILGPITPSALSTNILHIDTASTLTVTQTLAGFSTIIVNGGGTLATSWKDNSVTNSTITMPKGIGVVLFNAPVEKANIQVAGGTLAGGIDLNAGLEVSAGGTLILAAGQTNFSLGRDVKLGGTVVLNITKNGAALDQQTITSSNKIVFEGLLNVSAAGDFLGAGDSFRLFKAPAYSGYFYEGLQLPELKANLKWDTSQLALNGSIRVVQDLGNKAPAITLDGPHNPTLSAPARFNLISAASDPESALAKIEIFEGTTKIARSTLNTFTFELSGVSPGVHLYRAVATDHLGSSGSSSEFLVTVTASNIPPNITLTTPSSGTGVAAPATITLGVETSSADDDIVRVDYYRGLSSTGLVKFASSSQAPFSVSITNFPVSTWSLRAVAIDANGATNVSRTNTLQVLRSTSPSMNLQILHASDFNAGVEAIEDAVRFSQVLEALKTDYPTNTLILSSGNNYIPGPFFNASADPAAPYKGVQGRADIAILNALGVQATTFGNWDFETTSAAFKSLIQADPSINYSGTLFPYLSANIDVSADANLPALVKRDGQDVSVVTNSFAKSGTVTVGGQKVGLVGVTTPDLKLIALPGKVTVNTNLISTVQAAVDELLASGINKIVLLANLQQVENEIALAHALHDVDVVLAGGSHAVFANPTDRLREFDLASASYPVVTNSVSNEPVLIVNAGSNYRYVGRLGMEFDTNGVFRGLHAASRLYPTDAAGVVATGSHAPNPQVVSVVQGLATIIDVKDALRFGETTEYLNGIDVSVETEETNLGDITADANLWRARQTDPSTAISLKNGGGIRDSIGALDTIGGVLHRTPPLANPRVGKRAGEISQLDIENTLRFNNPLTLVTLTAQQLRDTMEWSVAASAPGVAPGQFPQVSGIAFSFDQTRTPMVYARDTNNIPVAITQPGSRLRSLIVTNANGSLDLVVEHGTLVGDPKRTFRTVTLDFLAKGGDSYFWLPLASNPVSLVSSTATNLTFFTDGTEQKALADYLATVKRVSLPDRAASSDTRIQNLSARSDGVTLPIFSKVLVGTGRIEVFFFTLPGKNYKVQSRASLNDAWQENGFITAGDGFVQSVLFLNGSSQGFYRLLRTN